MIKNLTFGKILMEVYHKNGEIMDKKKFVIFVLIVVFVSLCFWCIAGNIRLPKPSLH